MPQKLARDDCSELTLFFGKDRLDFVEDALQQV